MNSGTRRRVAGGSHHSGCEHEGFVAGLSVLNGRVRFPEDCSARGSITNSANVVRCFRWCGTEWT